MAFGYALPVMKKGLFPINNTQHVTRNPKLVTQYLFVKNLKSKRVGVHGFRVQRFNVSFLVKHYGINESRRNSQSNYSAVLRMNQPAVP